MVTNKLKVCFVSPYCYGLFNPNVDVQFGGSEVRISHLVRNLAQIDQLDVSLIVFDHGQPAREVINGVTLHAWKARPAPSPNDVSMKRSVIGVLRKLIRNSRTSYYFVSQLRRLLLYFGSFILPMSKTIAWIFEPDKAAIFDEVSADIFVTHGNTSDAALLAHYCRQTERRLLFLAASDMDYDPACKSKPYRFDVFGELNGIKKYVIEQVSHHVVQHQRQSQTLLKYFSRSSTLIRNPVDLKQYASRPPAPNSILWVGKSDRRVKQPHCVVELARQMPELDFIMVMTLRWEEVHQRVLSDAADLPNLTVIESVPFAQIETYFANARLHINTSRFEGFPNTFLQAAKYGVPTISLKVDPDGMLSHHNCGLSCDDDFDLLKEYITRLMIDDDTCAQIGQYATRYVAEYHAMEKIVAQYVSLFDALGNSTQLRD